MFSKDDKFQEFQIEEYKNISNAHFETNKQIGIFFRYLLLIASAPALIFIWFGKDNPNFIKDLFLGNEEVLNINIFVGFFLIVISIIDMLSSFYLIGLKLDNILYARTINGVRRYFYDRSEIELDEQYRVLPKQINIPGYFDNHTFGVLYYSIALINSIYFSIGTSIIAGVGDHFFPKYFQIDYLPINYNIWWVIIIFVSIFLLHIFYYNFVSRYRRLNYLKSRIIGIDIDGVLNKHRDTFCDIHNENMKIRFGDNIPQNKNLTPEEINAIPVSMIEGKNITKDDEFDVFNNPQYWRKQKLFETNVYKTIKELRNDFDYKINLYTYRPWPYYTYGNLIKSDNKQWNQLTLSEITKNWLSKNQIEYDNIFIEKNGIKTSKRSFGFWHLMLGLSGKKFKNRFYLTSKNSYRYFVEDDIDNAIKLSVNCEYVFLINQPYNIETKETLPRNIIRVNGWNDIKSEIKKRG